MSWRLWYNLFHPTLFSNWTWLLKGLWHASEHVPRLDFSSGEPFFKIGFWWKKSCSINPETPEKAIISVFKSYLVHFGSFKRHILYFCASIVEKFRNHWGEVHEAIFFVVGIPANGSNVSFNVVLWILFLSIKFSSQRSTFSG